MGHRIAREGLPSDDAYPPPVRVPVIVLGAGASGLAAAWRLVRRGRSDLLVVDLEPRIGGTSTWGRNAVSSYPWGAHYLPVPFASNASLVSLLREMGIVEGVDPRGEPVLAEDALCREPEERLFHHGYWEEGLYARTGASADDLRQLAEWQHEVDRWVALRDGRGRRAFAIPVDASSDDPDVYALDRVSAAAWMDRKGWTSPRLRWLVEYGLRDDYGLTLTTASAWAALFYACSRQRAPGEEPQPVLTWPEGNGRLVRHLEHVVGAERIRTRVLVTEVLRSEAGTGTGTVEVRGLDVTDRDAPRPVRWSADRVVFALPKHVARFVVREWREAPPPWLASFEHGAWMVANLTLHDRPPSRGFQLAWDNVIQDSRSLGYVVATHQRYRDLGPTVWTYYQPMLDADARAGRARLLRRTWREWRDIVVHDLERAHPTLLDSLDRIDVWRWGHAMVRPRVGFVSGTARRRAREPLGAIHFAHSDLSGVALFEEAFHHGLRAADEILAALAERG
ncbi:MAG: FAD-dependent oxidoreductase [Deltaproteobacteria bacterium]|nr:FAD-dependent oxidoreductase [Deltaproteobacteria bacterium]